MASTESRSNFIVTGGAGFVGSNLTLTLQERFPDARITVIDDFRSGNFKNLAGYRGDFVAQNLATLDWNEIEPMSRSGLIEFGSHTHTHPILSRCPLPRLLQTVWYVRAGTDDVKAG